MRNHATIVKTPLLAIRGLVAVLVLSLLLGGHFTGDAEHASLPGHDSQAVQIAGDGASFTDLVSGHCVSSVTCQFILPVELALLGPVAGEEPLSLAASGLIGSPRLNTLFRPPRQA
ncbi:MAG: hypothetical protein U1D35_10325 [Paracoccaceae bacterium]|nr:hypothetical protein [Paracoccaceae bacterium]